MLCHPESLVLVDSDGGAVVIRHLCLRAADVAVLAAVNARQIQVHLAAVCVFACGPPGDRPVVAPLLRILSPRLLPVLSP